MLGLKTVEQKVVGDRAILSLIALFYAFVPSRKAIVIFARKAAQYFSD